MSGLGITVKLSGSGHRKMKKLINKVIKTKPVMKRIADTEVKEAKRRVRNTKRDPDGGAWRPWSQSTLQARAGSGGSLLYLSGTLYRSFHDRVKRDKIEITNRADYAEYLQNGTRNMPARPFLGWGRPAINRVNKTMKRWFRV